MWLSSCRQGLDCSIEKLANEKEGACRVTDVVRVEPTQTGLVYSHHKTGDKKSDYNVNGGTAAVTWISTNISGADNVDCTVARTGLCLGSTQAIHS